MTDAFTDDLFAPTPFETDRVLFPVSRLICDVERFPDDADEPMAARGMGAVYIAMSDGTPLRQHLTLSERARIMQRWYLPHHAALTSAVDRVVGDGHACVIVDCHSFSSRPLAHEPDQEPNRPDVCIGTDHYHTPPELKNAVVVAGSAAGLSVLINRPFAGALVPAKHYRKEPRVNAVMIEVNRRLYMDENTGERLPTFGAVQEVIRSMLVGAIEAATGFCHRASLTR